MFLLELQEAIALHVKLDLNFQEFFALKIVETARNMELKLVMTGLTMGKDALLVVKQSIRCTHAHLDRIQQPQYALLYVGTEKLLTLETFVTMEIRLTLKTAKMIVQEHLMATTVLEEAQLLPQLVPKLVEMGSKPIQNLVTMDQTMALDAFQDAQESIQSSHVLTKMQQILTQSVSLNAWMAS